MTLVPMATAFSHRRKYRRLGTEGPCGAQGGAPGQRGAQHIVRANGTVEGEIKASNANISGTVLGDLIIAERLLLGSSARVEGTIKTGRLIKMKTDTTMSNLHLSMLNRLGVGDTKFGDSTGPQTGLA